VEHKYPGLPAGTTIPDISAGHGEGAVVIEPDGQYTPVSSPRYEAARLALGEAWEHRPPAYSWERAVFEQSVMPAARAELQAAWLEATEQREDQSRSAATDKGLCETRPLMACGSTPDTRPGPRAASTDDAPLRRRLRIASRHRCT
jgi:hypothetical protein